MISLDTITQLQIAQHNARSGHESDLDVLAQMLFDHSDELIEAAIIAFQDEKLAKESETVMLSRRSCLYCGEFQDQVCSIENCGFDNGYPHWKPLREGSDEPR